MSTRSPQHLRYKDLYRVTPRGFDQDLFKSFSKALVQGLAKASCSMSLGSPQELPKRTCERPGPRSSCPDILKRSQERHERTCCYWSGSYKILRQEPPKSLQQELSYKHLQDMASTRSSCKDLFERISPGSPQDLLSRHCTGSRKDVLESNLEDFHKIPFV